MVLIGQVNPQLVARHQRARPLAVGVSGEDAGLIRAVRPRPRARLRRRRRGDQPGDPATACSTTSSSRSSPRSAPTPTARRYNINADTVAGAIAEALGAEKLVYLTDIEGLRRVVDDPATLIRQTTRRRARRADRRRHDRRRDDPQGRELHPRRAQRRARAPTSSTAGSPTCCCSRSSPTRGSARWSSKGHTHDCAHVRHRRTDDLPVHAGVRRAAGDVRARQRHRAVGQRRQALPRLPVGHRRRRRSGTPTRRSPRRSPPGAHAAARQQLLRQPARRRRRRSRSTSCCSRPPATLGQVFFTNSGAEANECALEAGPQVRRARPPRRRQRVRQLPRPHAGGAGRHRPADQARAVLADAARASSTSPGATSTRSRAAVDGDGRRRC